MSKFFTAYLISLCLLFLPASGAIKGGFIGQTVLPVGGGFTLRQSQSGSVVDFSGVGDGTNTKSATFFTASASYTLTKADVVLTAIGNPSFNLTIEIWTDSAGTPGVIVGTGSGTIAASAAWSATTVTFTGISASLTNGTNYWIVIGSSSVGIATDYVRISAATQASTGIKQFAGSWSTYNSNEQFLFNIYSTP